MGVMRDRDELGMFVEGHKTWNKGKHLSVEYREKISQALTGKVKVVIVKEELKRLYLEENFSATKIAKLYGTSMSTVIRRIITYGIKQRSHAEAVKGNRLPNRPTKEELKHLYCTEKMNTPKIAKLLGVEKTIILTWMKEYNIPRRRRGESLSPTIKKLWTTSKYREKTTKAIRKKHRSQTMRDKKSKITKQLWKNPKFKAMMVQKIRKSIAKKPTKPEQNIIELIKKYALPFHYTGDGEVIIDGLNPDFVHINNNRKVIEVFGRVFHDPEESFFNVPLRQQYLGKVLDYKKRGCDCLILWEDEPKLEMLEKIREFA